MPPHTILIFESDDEDQQHTLMLMNHAVDMHIALSEILDVFRGHLKYNNQKLTDEQLDAVEKVHDQVIEKLDNNDVLKLI